MEQFNDASIRNPSAGVQALRSTSYSQVVTIVLDEGEIFGGPQNYHSNSDHWMYVISGSATATVDNYDVELTEGDLLLIAAGEMYQVTNDGTQRFITLNFVAPTAF